MTTRKRKTYPQCSCGLRKIDGLCPAGCERHRAHAQKAINQAARLRERERLAHSKHWDAQIKAERS